MDWLASGGCRTDWTSGGCRTDWKGSFHAKGIVAPRMPAYAASKLPTLAIDPACLPHAQARLRFLQARKRTHQAGAGSAMPRTGTAASSVATAAPLRRRPALRATRSSESCATR